MSLEDIMALVPKNQQPPPPSQEEIDYYRQTMMNDTARLMQAIKSPMPDERQLELLLGTQPKKKDSEGIMPWQNETFLESEVLRHIQLGYFEPQERLVLIRMLADYMTELEQDGAGDVAMHTGRDIFLRILSSKSIHGKEREMLVTNIGMIKSGEQPKKEGTNRGFFGTLIHGGKR